MINISQINNQERKKMMKYKEVTEKIQYILIDRKVLLW